MKTTTLPTISFSFLLFGLALIIVGVAINMTVMINNEGKMPVKADAQDFSNLVITKHMFFQKNSEVKHWYFADIIGFSVGNHYGYFSIGDVFCMAGIALYASGALFWWSAYRRQKKMLKENIRRVLK